MKPIIGTLTVGQKKWYMCQGQHQKKVQRKMNAPLESHHVAFSRDEEMNQLARES